MTTLAKQNRRRNGSNNLIDLMFNDDIFNFGFMPNETITSPQYDIVENENNYIINFMLPGFEKKDISIDIKDNTLQIIGERKINENNNYLYKGSFYGEFNKSFTLSDDININEIDASFENGILSIKVPKENKTKSNKSIKIK
jgi:HSP20 family protein